MLEHKTWRVRKYMHTLDRLALVVREEREATTMTVAELARSAGVDESLVRDVESGHGHDLRGVGQILDALGVKPLALPGDLARVR
ncbi:MAG: helix-turn-helix transcriptional regulator [Micrococcales bacterium]|nr:helix-turn-helix transcriptional regulator [Micrococcales bacterium]MCL2668501.1 helix-turn-helix transcriptional regulator [Micrococcales bacterium]